MSNGADRITESARDGFLCSKGHKRRRITRVFIDVDTQRDSMYPHGAAYFRQAAQIAPRLARLFSCARRNGYPVVSTTMCLRGNGNGNGLHCENGCIEGTNGQKKPAFSLLGRRLCFGPNGNTDLPPGLLWRYQQVIFEKRSPNPFDHPKFDRLLTGMMVSEYVVFGLVTEEAVRLTVLGLLARGKQVKLVVDATAGRDNHLADMALRLMLAKGARIITTQELAPRMQPRIELNVLLNRLSVMAPPDGLRVSRLAVPGSQSGGNGRNGNGKHAQAHGDNGNGNGNGNGKAHSKSVTAQRLSSSLKVS
ncbi:MAG: isochorismatase family protein [Actinobacteria bacterium]|nr:isochorismatase family protein [Actinomycetota bacterium]